MLLKELYAIKLAYWQGYKDGLKYSDSEKNNKFADNRIKKYEIRLDYLKEEDEALSGNGLQNNG